MASGYEWKTMHVTYEKPHIERLWREYGEGRLYLHRVAACKAEDSFYHPHPWPSAMHVMSGTYDNHVGDGNEVFSVTRMVAGSQYEMVNPKAWHKVVPVDRPAFTVMVTGPLFDPWVEMPTFPEFQQEELSTARRRVILDTWRSLVWKM